MQIKKGDIIRLIKPIRGCININEKCEVIQVKLNGEIYFKFHDCCLGVISNKDIEKYFEKVITNKVIYHNDNPCNKYILIKQRKGLEGLNLYEVFSLENISFGIVKIKSEKTNRMFYIAEEVLNENFVKIFD